MLTGLQNTWSKLIEVEEEIDKIIIVDFNAPLSIIIKICGQKNQ